MILLKDLLCGLTSYVIHWIVKFLHVRQAAASASAYDSISASASEKNPRMIEIRKYVKGIM